MGFKKHSYEELSLKFYEEHQEKMSYKIINSLFQELSYNECEWPERLSICPIAFHHLVAFTIKVLRS